MEIKFPKSYPVLSAIDFNLALGFYCCYFFNTEFIVRCHFHHPDIVEHMPKRPFFHVKKRTLLALAGVLFWMVFFRYSPEKNPEEPNTLP